jgi:cytochrome c-type biogenesis protein CcmH/NrfF
LDRKQTIQLGRLAEDVMDNLAFQAAMNQAMNEAFGKFLATEPQEDDVRFKLWATGQAIDGLKGALDAMVQRAAVEKRNKAEDERQER